MRDEKKFPISINLLPYMIWLWRQSRWQPSYWNFILACYTC